MDYEHKHRCSEFVLIDAVRLGHLELSALKNQVGRGTNSTSSSPAFSSSSDSGNDLIANLIGSLFG